MFQVRIHGRGGQGVVTAAEMLSIAAFLEGRHAQAFPSFGSERTGAPVVAFCRIDDKEIRLREPVREPDALIIQDPTLLHQVDVFGGLARDGYVLINTSRTFEAIGVGELARTLRAERLCTVPATELALQHVGRPVPNVALLGGFAAVSGRISLDSVAAAVREKFGGDVAEGNVAAARAAYEYVRNEMREASHAQAD
ncbi:MAG: 2-oxoacid:acceptor oxidoreductase family protein [Betaproteobacteria bacterium]|nr:2-oxoacid:acceptor oxidoreductase family protein [Betaproteobacteria bacterium]MDH5220697.1 2-oxoacid:acceptor oxidoreductase family protein [Betaproteobacteria bacterium]MDH5349703.1 2-oxoacid:acceptor oxidoreductase family protein [Betaproteobacteria bacterium]